ncbi:MAG: hypothetical protein JWR00_1804 [Rubritepida sp.]|nr:hypothetical protein [Rubritepida sp.]
MIHNVTGLFDSRAEADLVVEHLVQQVGINRSSVQVHAAGVDAVSDAYTTAKEEGGFWAALKDLFMAEEDRPAYAEGVRRGGVVVSAQVNEEQRERVMDVFEEYGAVDLDAREKEWRQAGWDGSYGPSSGLAATTGSAAPADVSIDGREEQTIPVVEETLRVGKRDVESGRVRVRSYVVETPVSEDVALRQEHVQVERRPVNRPLANGDQGFQDRSITATEHNEEVVVAKEARVTEELVIRKDVGERVETVHETVRRQDVEIDDTRHGGAVGTADSTPGGMPASSPPGTTAARAVDNGLDTNLSGANPKE